MEEKLEKDLSIFGEFITKNIILDTWPKKIWGAWKVLTGEAGIILVRINLKDIIKPKE